MLTGEEKPSRFHGVAILGGTMEEIAIRVHFAAYHLGQYLIQGNNFLLTLNRPVTPEENLANWLEIRERLAFPDYRGLESPTGIPELSEENWPENETDLAVMISAPLIFLLQPFKIPRITVDETVPVLRTNLCLFALCRRFQLGARWLVVTSGQKAEEDEETCRELVKTLGFQLEICCPETWQDRKIED